MHRLTHTLNLDHPCALFQSLFYTVHTLIQYTPLYTLTHTWLAYVHLFTLTLFAVFLHTLPLLTHSHLSPYTFPMLVLNLTPSHLWLHTCPHTLTPSHTTAQYLFGSPGKLLMEISNIGVLFGASIGMFVIIGDVAPATMISLFTLDWVSVMTVKIVIFLIVSHPSSLPVQVHCVSSSLQCLSSRCLNKSIR